MAKKFYLSSTGSVIENTGDTLGENSYSDGDQGGPPMDTEGRIVRMEVITSEIRKELTAIKTEIRELRYWIVGIAISLTGIFVAFSQYQATWIQHSADHHWELAQKAIDKIDTKLATSEQKFNAWMAKSEQEHKKWMAESEQKHKEWMKQLEDKNEKWMDSLDAKIEKLKR